MLISHLSSRPTQAGGAGLSEAHEQDLSREVGLRESDDCVTLAALLPDQPNMSKKKRACLQALS